MHTRKIAKFGNSHYILIDKTLLSLLGLKAGDEVKITIEGEKIVLSSLTKEIEKRRCPIEAIHPRP